MEYFSNFIEQLHSRLQEDGAAKKAPVLFLLEGDLGAGKTTFVKEFLRSYAYPASSVQSPTFLKLIEYPVSGLGMCVHLDTYRIEDDQEFEKLGLENYLDATYWFVEWPDRLLDYLKAKPELEKILAFGLRYRLKFGPHGSPVELLKGG
jgi:tRNA threonylcarbamoyl adenosine modification protein YjeE